MPYTADQVGYRDMDTSHEAAQEAKAPFWRLMVMQSLSMGGPGTADEIAVRLNASPLTVRPRMSELRNAGKIHDTGQRRLNASGKSAAVWAINTPKGGA